MMTCTNIEVFDAHKVCLQSDLSHQYSKQLTFCSTDRRMLVTTKQLSDTSTRPCSVVSLSSSAGPCPFVALPMPPPRQGVISPQPS